MDGMGIVYLAYDPELKRKVALKILRTIAPSPDEIKRLEREATAGAKLNHPCIIQIYDAGSHQGHFFFTMEYIKGSTFEEFIERPNAALDTKVDVLIKIARALQHAHDKKILHRDLKPSNILLDHNNEPYLTDFGLAKLLDRNTQLTQTGQLLGTPFFMSPEQVQGDKRIERASQRQRSTKCQIRFVGPRQGDGRNGAYNAPRRSNMRRLPGRSYR